MATAKRSKPKPQKKAVLKDEQIHLRVTAAQKSVLSDAATRDGIGLSSWLLMVGLREANKTG